MAIGSGRPVDRHVSVKLFVRYGDEERAMSFYRAALDAVVVRRHALADGALCGADLRIGDSVISVAGANPHRDADPLQGGPCSPHVLGTTATLLHLYVDDVEATIARAVRAGATLRNPIETTAAGERTGVFVDPFGHIWAVTTPSEDSDQLDAARSTSVPEAWSDASSGWEAGPGAVQQ